MAVGISFPCGFDPTCAVKDAAMCSPEQRSLFKIAAVIAGKHSAACGSIDGLEGACDVQHTGPTPFRNPKRSAEVAQKFPSFGCGRGSFDRFGLLSDKGDDF
jgi:hypothetical protein